MGTRLLRTFIRRERCPRDRTIGDFHSKVRRARKLRSASIITTIRGLRPFFYTTLDCYSVLMDAPLSSSGRVLAAPLRPTMLAIREGDPSPPRSRTQPRSFISTGVFLFSQPLLFLPFSLCPL